MTVVLSGEEIVARAQGLISAKKQLGSFSLDLTVQSVIQAELGGSLDFGGSEYQEAAAQSLPPVKKSPEEPYGWWHLTEGSYLIRFNERIVPAAKSAIMVVPHERLVAAGGSVTSLVLENLDETVSALLQVGSQGLAVKENARVCKAIVFTTEST